MPHQVHGGISARSDALPAASKQPLARRHSRTGEDVLEMLIHEFGIDCKEGALEAIRIGRRKFRSIQVNAATGDDPEAAATTLREMGYTVEPPEPLPEQKTRRLVRY